MNDIQEATAPPSAEPRIREKVRLSAARRAIAKSMVRSKHEIPHFSVSMNVDMTAVLDVRERWKSAGRPGASVNDFFIWASAVALRSLPVLNSRLEDDQLVTFEDIHIGLVASLGEKLIVPVIRHADSLDVQGVARRSRELLQLARDKKLTPAASEGGTFSVSNLGMHGVDSFVGIIYPGQAAILAVGRVAPRAVVHGATVAVRPTATLTLSIDHRIADGVVGAKFLASIKTSLEGWDSRAESALATP